MCNRTQGELGYYKGNERSQRLPRLWWKDRKFLPKVVWWSCYDPTCSRPRFDFGIEKWCLYPSARVSMDLVARKVKRILSYQFWTFEYMPQICSVHRWMGSNSGQWQRYRFVWIGTWRPHFVVQCNSDRRQGEWAIRVLERCPVTNVGPTIQPEVETVSM